MECSVPIDEHNISSFMLFVLTVLQGICVYILFVYTLALLTVTVHSTLPRHLSVGAHNSLGPSTARVSSQAR